MPKGVKGFQEGKPKTGGRAPGAGNKYTRIIKEALLIAAELEGSNQQGAGKLIGFMRMVAREELPTFCMMLARSMPLQVETKGEDTQRVEVTYRTVHEVRLEMERRGISLALLDQTPVVIDLDRDEDAEEDAEQGRTESAHS
jgi:hypothetical protein